LNILVLDTATQWGVLAVATTAGAVHTSVDDASRQHGRHLVPGIRTLLHKSGLSAQDIEIIAVGLGPGSYTGLRIGLTAAKTLAFATRAALIGLDSLEVVARNAPAEAGSVCVVADAQRGNVYIARFDRSGLGRPLIRMSPTRIEPFASFVSGLAEGTYVLGPGLEPHRATLPGSLRTMPPETGRPDPGHLLDVAREAWNAGRRDDPWFLEPFYLRPSAAEEQWDRLRNASEGRT